jgi:hypothetical protein
MPSDRPHYVSDLTDAELKRAKRDLQISCRRSVSCAASTGIPGKRLPRR